MTQPRTLADELERARVESETLKQRVRELDVEAQKVPALRREAERLRVEVGAYERLHPARTATAPVLRGSSLSILRRLSRCIRRT